jgi:2-(3-amino-3-carboxypropyl)histidine synthase
MYDLKIGDVLDFARKRGVKRLLLQFANGLKQYSCSVVEELNRELPNVEVLVSGSSCYGACDLAFEEALRVGADGIVHYGHSPFPETFAHANKLGIDVLFVEAFSKAELLSKAVDRSLDVLCSMKDVVNVGITASLQEVPHIALMRQRLEKEGYRVLVGFGSDRVKYAGQVLGCDYTSALSIKDKVEIFIHLSGGLFHALGLGLATQRPVVLCDPYRGEAREIEYEVRKVKAARLYYVVRAMEEAKQYCVVIGCKWRQRHLYSAMRVKKKLEEKGKKVYLLILHEVSPQALENFPEPDAFIITACPRIPIDDYMNYRRPVLTVLEALIIARELKLEEWSLCDWELNEKAARDTTFKNK